MDHHRSPLGHLAFPRPLSFAERTEVETLSNIWRVGDACASLVLVATTSPDHAVGDLRRIVRRFCGPRTLGLQGVVVLESHTGLYAVTAAGRRVRCRALGPAATPGPPGPPGAPGSGSGPVRATAECRVIHLDQHRHRLRTAPRDRSPDRPGAGPDGDGWSS